jgi:hypothetical protein
VTGSWLVSGHCAGRALVAQASAEQYRSIGNQAAAHLYLDPWRDSQLIAGWAQTHLDRVRARNACAPYLSGAAR